MDELQVRIATSLGDRYHIERVVGRGGMAIVFLAHDLKHHRQVAIKVLRPELALSIGPERFLREIAVAAQLNHPHILPLHDSGDADGLLYYVMPFVPGETLRDRLDREGRLRVDDVVRIARETADALAHAHRAGLVHRDIKPENILFQAGHALVADFGIARAAVRSHGDRLTETGVVIGTPVYMSPEQALGDIELDGRSDIYSLGCVVYEMLVGTPPFSGATGRAVIAAHASAPVPSIRRSGVRVSFAVERAVQGALAKDPAHRFATADAFIAALEGGAVRVPEHARVRRIAVTAIGAGLVVVAAATWAWQATTGGGRITSLAVLPLENRTRDTAQEFLAAGVHEALIDELARIADLRVISRTSALLYRDARKPIPEIARELVVDGVVQGSIERTRDTVQLEIQLIQARPNERQIWARSYRQDLRGLALTYRNVAGIIARELGARLSPREQARLAAAPSVDPAAYEAYLRGVFHWQKLTPADLTVAEQYFELALQRDSNYAPAHSGLAEVWISRLQMGLASPAEATPRATAAARRALELDSTLATAHYDLALIAIQRWEWDSAEAAFQRAFALDPGFPDANAYHSHLLNIVGRTADARRAMDRALARDPLNPLFQALDAVDLLFERRWAEARGQAERALAVVPDQPVALYALWLALHAEGRGEEASKVAARYFAASAQPAVAEAWERGRAAGGYREGARRAGAALAARAASSYVTGSDVATVYATINQTEETLGWLERAYETHDPSLPYLRMPVYDVVRGAARFQTLAERMGLAR